MSNQKSMVAKSNNRNQSGGFVPVMKSDENLSKVNRKDNMKEKNGQAKKRGPYNRGVLTDKNDVPEGYLRQSEVAKILKRQDADLSTVVQAGHIHAYVVFPGGKERKTPPVYVNFEQAKKYFTKTTDSFDNVRQVAEFLIKHGYKISKSKIYEDAEKGHLKVARDGSVGKSAVNDYTKKINQWHEDHQKAVSEKNEIQEIKDQLFEVNKKFDDLQRQVETIRDITGTTCTNLAALPIEIIECFLIIFQELGGDLNTLPNSFHQKKEIIEAAERIAFND